MSICICRRTSANQGIPQYEIQSQEILNRPLFVLDILKSVSKFWKLLKILNITENSEQILKILKIAENPEQILNNTENSEQILNIAENSEQILKFWPDSELYWKFWTDSEHYWNSEQILNIIFLLKSIYFTSFSLDFN